ncbi:MAG: hypothetical protein E7674_00355 [Ruminococcaceae bacterium]|nr:hypothetical protein [Oscillospiraceae bacterium]
MKNKVHILISAIAITLIVSMVMALFPACVLYNDSSADYDNLPTVGMTNLQQKNEDDGLESLIGDPDREINFSEIIENNKDTEYRSTVEIKDDTLVIVRTETASTPSIEDEEWYANEGFVGYETVSEDVDAVTGEKLVTYRLQADGADVWALTDKLNDSNVVVAAEPDYIFHICDVPNAESNVGVSSQWYLEQLDMFSIWGDESVYGNATGEGAIVAVIDTGVDFGHEDLKDNMWINTAELLGEDGVDDDRNGYIDDIYGVSFIDSKATPMDDNGHGTHVAGIIAMADNNVGGVGIAYNAKIMAIKAGQSDGTLSSSDIAKAIEYARKNGADVINMSFGSYAHSAVVEAALQDAFSTCVLVAAAGNDGMPTLDAPALCKGNMYPASYSYVIGVMASDSSGNLASFSNWDFRPNYGAEYEVMAPGADIYSTLPGDRYASWSGTSMATPVVSAVAAIIRSANPDKSTYSSRYIMGQIASATEDQYFYPYATGPYAVLNAKDSITKMPKPKITIDEVYIFDSTDIAPENNGDGIVQPGETIDIAVGLRNQWGAATNVRITVDSVSGQPGVVHPYVTYITDSFVNVNDIGTFQKQNNGFVYDELNTVVGVSNPVRVKISEDAPNDAHIAFYINYTASNLLDSSDTSVYRLETDYVYSLTVQNGVVLKGKITENMTLTPDNYYIIENSLLIPRGVTVNVDPGTQIQFWSTDSSTVYGDTNIAYIQVEGTFNVNGTQENPVTMSLGKDYEIYPVEIKKSGKGVVNMSYASIMNPVLDITTGDHLSMMQDYDYIIIRSLDENGTISDYESRCEIRAESIKYSKVSNIRGNSLWSRAYVHGSYDTVLFENCQISYQEFNAVNCTFLINQGRVEDPYSGMLQYFSSLMYTVGDSYREPIYETISPVINHNGKKYVVYRFENYFFDDYWDSNLQTHVSRNYDNYITLLNAIGQNGGAITDMNNQDENELCALVYDALDMGKSDTWYYFVNGIHYDRETSQIVSGSGEVIESTIGLSYKQPISNFNIYEGEHWIYNEETQQNETEKYYYPSIWTTDGLERCVIAEYPESVSDYTVENPVFNLGELDILESTRFTNNAILNRLTSKNTDDWMKLSASQNNTYTYAVGGNYWGTVDANLIQKQLVDFDTNIRYGDYVTDPILTAPDSKTYPCVSDIYILDKDGNKTKSVGNGDIEIHVIFNRAMDKNVQPMVTYGPDDPYTDYSFEGDWVSDTEWVGKATIKTLINQGQQYIRVKNAVAADDAWLTTGTDWARFEFMVESSGAEALTLQGEGVKGGIYLNWVQDEFDTLAGYNVYRSLTGEEGTYKKVNTSIISGDTKEFTDTTVSCGKKYYYYFTVVDTALVESRPSNVITSASIDDQEPAIKPSSLKSVTLGLNATLLANISDNVGVNGASLFYRMSGQTEYTEIRMTCTNNTSFSAQIPAKALELGTLEYYFSASDSLNTAYYGSAEAPLTCPVETKVVVTSISCEGGEVGNNITATIHGLNFTPDMEIYVDNTKVEFEYVSADKVLITSYVADCLGHKKLSIYVDGQIVAYLTNAITVTDDSIYVKDVENIIIKEYDQNQQLQFVSNFTGKITSVEIVYKHYYPEAQQSIGIYPCSWNSETCNEYAVENYTSRTFKCNFTVNEGDSLLYCDLYNIKADFVPEIVSVKINGITIENLTGDESCYTFIDEAQYVEVEQVEIVEYPTRVEVGDTFDIEYTVYPQSATKRNKVSFSYNSDVIQQNEDGSFTAVSSGSVDIWVYVDGVGNDEGKNHAYIQIDGLPVSSLVPEKTSYVGVAGSKLTINITAEPLESDAYINSYINWSDTSNVANTIATYNRGREIVVELITPGRCTLYVYSNNMSIEIPIEVLENKAYVDIAEDVKTLYPNQSATVTSQLINANASEQSDIIWTSSNKSVAKVNSDGTITAVGNGYALITASVNGGAKTDSVIVIVGTDSMSYTRGDVNMDGKVTSADAMLVLKLALMSDCSDAIAKIADVNGDNAVTASDALMILQYVTGAIKTL